MLLSEVFQNAAPQAAFAFAVANHGIQTGLILLADDLPLNIGQLLIVRAVVDHKLGRTHISGRIEQHALCTAAVPACPARFLIIAFNGPGHIVVDHEADVGFVDAHAEGVGGHHYGLSVIEEVLLIDRPLLFIQTRMVAGGIVAPVLEEIADSLHIFPGCAVDNAAFALSGGQKPQQFPVLTLRMPDFEIQIRPVKACDAAQRVLQLQQPPDILLHLFGGSGRIGTHHRPLGQSLDKLHDPKVAGPEILAPLGDAVGFIHRNKGNGHFFRKGGKTLAVQPLRRHIQDLDIAHIEIAVHIFRFPGSLCTVQVCCRNARSVQCLDLIPHQGDQRRDHHCQPRQQQSRDLIAHAFTAAGGHDAQHIPAGQYPIDQFFLPRSEFFIAVDPAEKLIFIHIITV